MALSGEYCQKAAMTDQNFAIRLHELDKNDITNGLVIELDMWSRTKNGKDKRKFLMNTFITKYVLPPNANKTIPKMLADLQTEKKRVYATAKRKKQDNIIKDFLNEEFVGFSSIGAGLKRTSNAYPPDSPSPKHHHYEIIEENLTIEEKQRTIRGRNEKLSSYIYLDYNATTPLEGEVLQAIHDALDSAWGNPSSSYQEGCKAKAIINAARSEIACMVGGTSEDIIFTSGGTEANNWVIHTAIQHFHESFSHNVSENDNVNRPNEQKIRPHIITSNIEHDSVKLPLENLAKAGKIDLTCVPVSKLTGHVEVDDILSAIRPTTCLVTIMHANNETGIIQPISDIMKQVKTLKRNAKHGVCRTLLHTDAAQTIGKIPINAQDLDVDYLTIVGHKFYAPRIGALYVRGPGKTTPVYPMFYGGGQERNFRPGTENTGMIAGLGKAAELVNSNIETYQRHMEDVRDYLEQQLKEAFGNRIHLNSRFPDSERLPNTCNVSISGEGLYGYKILGRVKHLHASVGAACHSGTGNKPSHILLASGIPEEIAANALRLSVGRHTTKEDIDVVIEDIKQAVKSLDSV
ncbi:selenocysteine lyase-like [Amphiura filiformis]|uniref:selenocysteine lyase-like n=1 Tax=Amphiura filiformis TaxID=82378 RepID=UPI003B220AA7